MAGGRTVRDNAICIIGAGAQTPVGRSLLASAAAIRCNISAAAEHPFMIDRHGEPMVVARAPWLDLRSSLDARITELAVDAAKEAIYPIAPRFASLKRHMHLYIALSADSLDDRVRRVIADRVAAGLDLLDEGAASLGERLVRVADGHAAGLLALENAVRDIQRGKVELALVGGADSWIVPERLESIDYAGRMHTVKDSWGFMPGEGAAFTLLTTGAIARRFGVEPLGEILSVACTGEEMLMATRTVCTGQGLTAAFVAALEGQPRVTHTFCDLNGEIYRAEEYGFAITRTGSAFENADRFTAAAAVCGDVGSASGSLAVGLSVAAFARSAGEGPVHLAWSSSATMPLRAAAVLRQPGVA
ncbi:MAG TPA: beta-ketoacyl synthase N-terminal-like domain-containing protein [Vicinamibacterales bacterium]